MVWKKLISVKRPLSIEPTDTIQLSCVCVCVRARACALRVYVTMSLVLLSMSVTDPVRQCVRTWVSVRARDWKKLENIGMELAKTVQIRPTFDSLSESV